VILASASPRRRQLVRLLGLPVRAVAAEVDETAVEGEPPAGLAARLARAKARAVSGAHPHELVVGCDTVVALDGQVLGKPAGEREAREMLEQLRSRAHTVYTGVAVVQGERERVQVVETTVHMRDYTDAELVAYVASGDPLDKAGAYAIQHPTFRPVDSWEGCYANVVGFPVCHVARMLQEWGVHPAADIQAACRSATGETCLEPPLRK
jgi:septum formation protein